MPKKITLKTQKTSASVSEFIASIADEARRQDAKQLLAIMRKVTGKPPKMWGDSIIGFGTYQYTRSNGDTGEFLATGFSPRKAALSLYIMPGYSDMQPLLAKLGPHKTGKGCLYIRRLEEVDTKVLERIITKGYQDLQKQHPVT